MQNWLSKIVAKASTLAERLGPDFVTVHSVGRELVDARMRAWLGSAARGDRQAFQRRLAWEALDEQTADRAISPVRLRADATLPSWATKLSEILRLATSTDTDDRCLDREDPVAFEDLLVPFVIWARSACMRAATTSYGTFNSAAHRMLEHSLLKLLSGIAGRTLLVELAADVAEERSLLDLLDKREPCREVYKDFVARMRAGGLIGFFQEYAALARLLATKTELWVEATVELLQRFRRDRYSICAALGIQGNPEVAGVESCASDPHNGLRSVTMLILASGQRVIYKPRAMAVEAAWNHLLQYCQTLEAPADLRTYRILDRGGYGWAEYVPEAPCRDAGEASRYVTRCGALLALVYLLGGTDCHADNLVPAGEHPVLIDVETLLAPKPRDCSARTDAPRAAHERLWRSVLSSYLLPKWTRGINDDLLIDASALGARPGGAQLTGPGWVDINTDHMRLVRAPSPPESSSANLSELGFSRSIYEHELELLRGFEAMYRFIANHRDELLQPDSPFQRLRWAPVRFVYRNTATYAAILDRLTTPEFLRDGAERSIAIEELACAALAGEGYNGRPGWAAIWRCERDAVERGDVPHFASTPGASTLCSGSQIVAADWFPECSHDLSIKRLGSLDDLDLKCQIDIIRSTLRSRTVRTEPASSNRGAISALPPGPEDPDPWIAEAVTIAQQLVQQAIRGADGTVSWIQLTWSRELPADPPVAELRATGHDLYSGAPGIALFLAAAEHAAPGGGLLPIALGAIQPLLADLSAGADDFAEEVGLGGLCGIGSAVYALTCISELLHQPALLSYAELAANLITDKRIDADLDLDVTLGSAGALLALLALHEASGSSSLLSRALQCGDRLLARFEEVDKGARAIRTLEGKFLAGFSHGAAGMAYALSCLYSASGDSKFLQGARQLIAFERTAYSHVTDDWPDLRHPGLLRFMPSWCHGAPGIALGRAASLAVMDDPETRHEIDRALAITRETPDGADCLCCGNLGRVETLWTAGNLLGCPDLCRQAQSLAWHRVQEARHHSGYVTAGPSAGQFRCLGLFQGLAGVGYMLLRLALPERIPEVLLLRRARSTLRNTIAHTPTPRLTQRSIFDSLTDGS